MRRSRPAPGRRAVLCAKGSAAPGSASPRASTAASAVAMAGAVSSDAELRSGRARGDLGTAVRSLPPIGGVSPAARRGAIRGRPLRVYHAIDDLRGRRDRRRGEERARDRLRRRRRARPRRERQGGLIARGFAESSLRRAAAPARDPDGLSGLGDLVLTCTSAQSRNFAFGERLGRERPDRGGGRGSSVEGASRAVLVALARAGRLRDADRGRGGRGDRRPSRPRRGVDRRAIQRKLPMTIPSQESSMNAPITDAGVWQAWIAA